MNGINKSPINIKYQTSQTTVLHQTVNNTITGKISTQWCDMQSHTSLHSEGAKNQYGMHWPVRIEFTIERRVRKYKHRSISDTLTWLEQFPVASQCIHLNYLYVFLWKQFSDAFAPQSQRNLTRIGPIDFPQSPPTTFHSQWEFRTLRRGNASLFISPTEVTRRLGNRRLNLLVDIW